PRWAEATRPKVTSTRSSCTQPSRSTGSRLSLRGGRLQASAPDDLTLAYNETHLAERAEVIEWIAADSDQVRGLARFERTVAFGQWTDDARRVACCRLDGAIPRHPERHELL